MSSSSLSSLIDLISINYLNLNFKIHGDMLVTGSDDNTLRVWSIEKGRLTFALVGHTGGVWTSQISEDGKFIVSGSTDRSVKVRKFYYYF